MCGIMAYVGDNDAAPILLSGLKALEYRGYDSAGMYVYPGGLVRAVGKVSALESAIPPHFSGSIGIAHTRWATHGIPSETNAHPHADCGGSIFVVHNGIIENYAELKEQLISQGHVFASQTDSEVLAHLIEARYLESHDLLAATQAALALVRGTYGIVVLSKELPEEIIVARMGSPIVIGIAPDARYIASDPTPLLPYTRTVLYLSDGDIARVTRSGERIVNQSHETVERAQSEITWNAEVMSKSGYPHFMLKEIMEIPSVLRESARGRIVSDSHTTKLGGLESVQDRLKEISSITIVGCGSAYYAGMVGQQLLERFVRIPVYVEIASEFRYRDTRLPAGSAVLAVSQSGETADTLACIRKAKEHGALTLGLINAVGSTIARETDAGVYNHAGPEIGVASTKAFISQIEVFALMAVAIAQMRDNANNQSEELIAALEALPERAATLLMRSEEIRTLAKRYASYRDFLFIGRKWSMPIAFEGALKLKEVSYVHAEGYGAGEMKHGPLAMIDEQFPTIAIVPRDEVTEKTISNMQEIRARKGKILAFATEGDTRIASVADDVFYMPQTHEALSPILSAIPLQLFAYYAGVERGYDVDKPRNLAKSVTVE